MAYKILLINIINKMTHKLKNNSFQIIIDAKGAELNSFKSLISGQEYIWQGDPSIWAGHSPVLFPIVGGLKDDTYFHENKEYKLARHGFVRRNEDLTIEEQTPNSITFSLTQTPNIRKLYPFDFEFNITYKLLDDTLLVQHSIKNLGDDDMLFSLGAHPAFNCPINKGESYSDYALVFSEKETLSTWNLNADGIITEEGERILDNSKTIYLHEDIFENDALIFKALKSKEVKLVSKKSATEVILSFNDFKSLGLWAKPKAPFVCIEPWLGYADVVDANQELTDKEGIIKLLAGKIFSAEYSIQVKELLITNC